MRRRFVEARWDQASSLRPLFALFLPFFRSRFSSPPLSLFLSTMYVYTYSPLFPAPLRLYSLSARFYRWSRGASCASQVLPVRCIRRVLYEHVPTEIYLFPGRRRNCAARDKLKPPIRLQDGLVI